MSDLVGNPEDRFSQNEAHLYFLTARFDKYLIEIRLGVKKFFILTCNAEQAFFASEEHKT